jgi:hypothetical protein
MMSNAATEVLIGSTVGLLWAVALWLIWFRWHP